jgi:hypothetical protein
VDYKLSVHASEALKEREISVEWVERTIRDPQVVEPDIWDPDLERRYRVIPENANRVLRVVVKATVEPLVIISVFFDRRMRGKI